MRITTQSGGVQVTSENGKAWGSILKNADGTYVVITDGNTAPTITVKVGNDFLEALKTAERHMAHADGTLT